MLSLTIVYLVWGSSFLFTKIGVANLPPALFAGARFTAAGILLALVAYVKSLGQQTTGEPVANRPAPNQAPPARKKVE